MRQEGAMTDENRDENVTDAVWSPPAVGTIASWVKAFSASDVENYALITGDRNPIHFNHAFAERTRFGGLVVQGGLTAGLFNALVAMKLPGPGSVFLSQRWEYSAPVYLDDLVEAEAEVTDSRADKPITTLRCVARRSDGTVVLSGTCVVYTLLPQTS
jgi:acyl dehydratase